LKKTSIHVEKRRKGGEKNASKKPANGEKIQKQGKWTRGGFNLAGGTATRAWNKWAEIGGKKWKCRSKTPSESKRTGKPRERIRKKEL